jgi:hypothetical protein
MSENETATNTNTKLSPSPPSVALTKSYLRKWETLEKYKSQEDALTLLFQEFCPHHDDIVHVLLKVSALNDFYGTNIYNTHAVAKHIVALKVDQRIAEGDHSVVNEIAAVTIGGKARNCYSFASKYCNHHNPERFPIYDSYVETMLLHFRKTDRFAAFAKADLKKYHQFVGIIEAFRQHYLLEQFSLRQIDIYLWLAGKEAFRKHLGSPKTELGNG